LIRRLAHWRRGHTPLTLLLVQVDEFPGLAEKYGSTSTEAVLRIAAQLINAVMRDMDHVARLGEDTFALLLPGAALSNGVAIAERLRNAVERCRLPRRAGISRFTVSIGVVEAGDGDDLRHILERGRTTLQTAIGEGRNRVVGGDAQGERIGGGLAVH
jgi:diguanylate cyclase